MTRTVPTAPDCARCDADTRAAFRLSNILRATVREFTPPGEAPVWLCASCATAAGMLVRWITRTGQEDPGRFIHR